MYILDKILYDGREGKKVKIVTDCREGSPATGKIATFEGKFNRTVIVCWKATIHDTPDLLREYMYDEWILLNSASSTLQEIPEFDGFQPTPQAYWFPVTNPRFRFEDGSVIWGDECWWQFVDESIQ